MKDKSDHFAAQLMPMEAKRVIIKLRILGRLKIGRTYSYAIIKEFHKAGFADFYGPTLKNDTYNALNVLTKAGYIKLQHRVVSGKVKNYYVLTKLGDRTLKSVGKMMVSTIKEASRLFR
ncbi:MAG: PadR family transcriptional regulator [Candidatus Marsarchaeota archaeon]|nr:PadR family transcriptional regulator [Candidatus Marsarchaeota archaeon]